MDTATDVLAILQRMLTDIKDPSCYYWVNANYFEVQPPTHRQITQWWQGPLFLDYDSIWNASFTADAMLCEVILKNQLPAERERILLPFDQVYRICRFWHGQNTPEAEYQLFYEPGRVQMPPIPR